MSRVRTLFRPQVDCFSLETKAAVITARRDAGAYGAKHSQRHALLAAAVTVSLLLLLTAY